MKKKIFHILNSAGLSALLRLQKKDMLTVLSLHRISNESDFFWNPIKPADFEKLLQYLVKYYSIISFSDIQRIQPSTQTSKPFLILSFDDGYYDFYKEALPLLVKYKLPCNHNIVNECASSNMTIWTQRLNNLFNHCRNNNDTGMAFSNDGILLNYQNCDKNWMKFYLKTYHFLISLPLMQRIAIITEKERQLSVNTDVRMMNWQEIKECTQYKVEIGCHTYSHDVLSTINDRDVLFHEIVEASRETGKQLGKAIDILALPNGQGNELVNEMALLAGLKHVLYVADKINPLQKYTNGAGINDTYRVNMVQESMPEMILRAEMFHAKIRRYA